MHTLCLAKSWIPTVFCALKVLSHDLTLCMCTTCATTVVGRSLYHYPYVWDTNLPTTVSLPQSMKTGTGWKGWNSRKFPKFRAVVGSKIFAYWTSLTIFQCRRLCYIAPRHHMWVSHCINETPWYKTRPSQAWSIHKLECALRRFLPTDRLMPQTRKVQNWWRDQTLSDVNLHESSRGISAWLATPMKFSSLTGEAKETSHQHTSTVWDRSQENYKETTKTNQLTWRVRDLSVRRETWQQRKNSIDMTFWTTKGTTRKIQSALIRATN